MPNTTIRSISGLQRRLPVGIKLVAVGLLMVLGGLVAADYFRPSPMNGTAQYVGRQSCLICHPQQANAFQDSHHDLAMDIATEETVLGDFSGVSFQHDGIASRMFRKDGRFMIHTEGPDGRMQDFQVKYVFGVHPLQQYMVEFDRTSELSETEISRLQVLRISWNTLSNEWFYLRPPGIEEKLDPHDDLHWTGVGQRWQMMCAECHSTNLQRNFDPQTNQYRTSFSEIDVSCEACHGPASLHVALANRHSLFWDRHHGKGLARLSGEDPETQLQMCATCHSRRGLVAPGFKPGSPFTNHYNLELLQPESYFADGQIKDEVYVYGSFLQSRMYHKGIRCSDCHDPHSTQLKHNGNAVCTSCHQHPAGKYDTPSHHHHAPGKPGSFCVDCHMPSRTYMAIDARRDHSFRIPRPDLSLASGTPNACTACHVADRIDDVQEEKREYLKEYADWQRLVELGDSPLATIVSNVDRWCNDACDRWYGSSRHRDPHFAQSIVAARTGQIDAADSLLDLISQPNERTAMIVKATALEELSQLESVPSRTLDTASEILKDTEQHPMVQAAAVRLLGAHTEHPETVREQFLPLLKHTSTLVRNEAATQLARSPIYTRLSVADRKQLDAILSTFRDRIMESNDRAGTHLHWGDLCEQRGMIPLAINAYKTAIRVEPKRVGPRTHLANLLERISRQRTGPGKDVLNQRVLQLRQEELPLLARDAKLLPENPLLQYRYGLSLYLNGQPIEALKPLQRSVQLAPDNSTFRDALNALKEYIAKEEKTKAANTGD